MMTTVTLGKTQISSPKNAFGALPIQRVSLDVAVALLRKAREGGFTYFDTARAYTDSENKLGVAFEGMRDRVTIATKSKADTPEELKRDLETSLRALRTDHIDVYQFHNPAFCPLPGDGTGLYEFMEDAKRQGMIRHIGITNHRLGVAEQAVLSGMYETLQFPFCYLATERDVALVRLCREHNVGFVAMKALSGGLLTRADACYAYLSQFDNVLPIWGIQREAELDQFLSFMNEPPLFDEKMAAFVHHDKERLSGDFCRGCGYCMPCPQNIRINDCARMSQLIRRSPSAYWLSEEGQKMMMQIEQCVGCGACAAQCPYNLDTPALLRRNLEDYKNILSGKTKI